MIGAECSKPSWICLASFRCADSKKARALQQPDASSHHVDKAPTLVASLARTRPRGSLRRPGDDPSSITSVEVV
jgi:hypothetical protein